MSWFMMGIILLGLLAETSSEASGEQPKAPESWSQFWVFSLMFNLVGYATIFVPGALLIRHMRKIKYNETAGKSPGCLSNFAVLCVFGKEKDQHANLEEGSTNKESQAASATEESFSSRALQLLVCVGGLQISYLSWGLLQERIMTIKFGETATEPGEYFKDSQFLVFVNRILAFIMALLVIFFRSQPPHTAPLYKYSFCSFSNIMSSWCQYEALKFVSFPTQVLAKASKVIPVMLMGKVISKKTYDYSEYLTAVMISVGVSMFLLTSGDATRRSDSVTTYSGLIILAGYMVFDSFTSNWQGELFTQYKMSSIQMMAGVNMFSCLLTTVSLIEQGGFFTSAAFMIRHPEFVFDVVILSICSATGQLFIFYTISRFGPVIFVIIMTVRQAFAILLSCIIYTHPVSFIGVLGIFIVFLALFLKIYANQRKKTIRQATNSTNSSQKA